MANIMTERGNAVIVRVETVGTFHYELRHGECADGDPLVGDAEVQQPNRDAYSTDAAYDRAVWRAYRCTYCGGSVADPPIDPPPCN